MTITYICAFPIYAARAQLSHVQFQISCSLTLCDILVQPWRFTHPQQQLVHQSFL